MKRHHVDRVRLVRVVERNHIVALEAPGGYGKSTLAIEVAEALSLTLVRIVVPDPSDGLTSFLDEVQHAFEAAGVHGATASDASTGEVVASMAAALRDPLVAGLLIVIDEAQRLDAQGETLIEAMVRVATDPHRVVIAGRRIPFRLVHAGTLIGPDELMFSNEETAVMFAAHDVELTDGEAQLVGEQMRGWPAGVSLLASQWTRGGSGVLTSARSVSAAAESLLHRLLERAGPTCSAVIQAIAQLPFVSAHVVGAVDDRCSWSDVLDTGLPLVPIGAGWHRLSDPLRDLLRSPTALDPSARARVAQVYAAHGEALAGFDLLVSAGALDDTAMLLASLDTAALEQLSPGELRALHHVLGPDLVGRHPRAVLQLARLGALTADIGERAGLLDQVGEVARRHDDAVLLREVEAERACDLARSSRIEEACSLGMTVLAACGESERWTRARVLSALGLAEGTHPGGDHGQAAAWLIESAALFRHLGSMNDEAGVLLWLGYHVQFADGHLAAAITTLQRAVALLPADERRRGTAATFLAEVLCRTGRTAEALTVIDEAQRIGRLHGDVLTMVYASWVAADIAAIAGDGAGVMFHLAAIEGHRGDWWGHTTGTDFLANAADICRRVGRLDEAAAYLSRAEGRTEGTVATLEFTRAARDAFDGDAASGAATLESLRHSGRLHRVDAPRAVLLQAFAHRRLGRTDADQLAAQARREAAALGVEPVLALYEPHVSADLGLVGDALVRLRLQLLGGFAARLGDRLVELPPGRGSTLVKQLALAGRPLTLDQVLEALWPYVDPNTARRRLRNLLNRLREDCGELVVRTDSGLALLPGATTDVHDFLAAVESAMAADDDPIARCHHAAALYRGELLPDDRYEDWCAVDRERLARLHVRVLDRAARLLLSAGEYERALADLDKAIAAEPTDPYRYLDAAEAASAAGRPDTAAQYVRGATAVLAELALRPDDRFRQRVAALGLASDSV